MARKKNELKLMEGAVGVLLSIVAALVELLRERGVSLESVAQLARPEGKKLLLAIADALAATLTPVAEVAQDLLRLSSLARFNPEDFFWGKRWSIEEGDTDKASLALNELDPSKLVTRHFLNPGGTSITGEEDLKRAKESGLIRLDLRWFLFFWNHQEHIPADWKERDEYGNIRYFRFAGEILRGPHGNRHALYLYWSVGRWHWNDHWLAVDHGADVLAVLLAK